MNRTRDVVIIGAGLAGSSMAAALAAQGWDVLLVERDHLPRHKVCGEFLSPESQGSLQALGLLELVKALDPSPVANAKMVTQGGLSLYTPLPGCAWGISRYALDAALAAAAQERGAELYRGMMVQRYEAEDGMMSVYLREGSKNFTIQTRTLIAACGRHSQAGLPPKARTRKRHQHYVGIKRHYRNVIMPAQVELFLFPGGYAGINPVEGERINLCLLAAHATFVQTGKRVESLIAQTCEWNPSFAQRLRGGEVITESEATVAPVDLYRAAVPWDGIACLGDSAVMIPPFCGDGMAMALRSAELCAPLAHQFLAGTLTREQWAEQYSHAWHSEFDYRLRIARLLQHLLDHPKLAEWAIRIGHTMPRLTGYFVRATRGDSPLLPRSSKLVFQRQESC